ncbi:MAG: flagellar biosynthesis anti-sigma factor FlgM [Gammaproteobacteria bacterium]|nr:flagellar biosynthesis anti-sigma factor FlgM [Gammaproteobacteria bacterium]
MSEINNIKTSSQALLNSTRDVKTRNTNNDSTQSRDVSEKSSFNDKVSLTETATQLQSLRQAVADSPEVNTDRVAALRAVIADGSFEVDSETLAQNLFNFDNQF